jgi:hypothetical protein
VVGGSLLWRPLRRTLDVGAFGINAYVAPNAGDDVVEEHWDRTLEHEEVYVVLARTGDVHARRRVARRAGRDGRLRARPAGEAPRPGRGAADSGPRGWRTLDLILDVRRRDTRRIVLAHRADDVQRIPVAVVGVGDHRHADGLHEAPCLVCHLRERKEPDIRTVPSRMQMRSNPSCRRVESSLLGQLGRECVIGAWCDDQPIAREHLPEPCRTRIALSQPPTRRKALAICLAHFKADTQREAAEDLL